MASDRDAVAWRMQPGAWDERGFLGPSEGLTERIEADTETCTRLGTTPEAVGKRLLGLLAEARARADAEPEDEEQDATADGPVDADATEAGDWPQVTIRSEEGEISCPWALEQHEVCLVGPGGNPSADRFTVVLGDETLEGYTLAAHLIACHRFFGGLDSCFRIDPAQALAVLDPG